MQTKPKKGKGERYLDCPCYNSCLDFAAVQNFKAFNCEQCGYYLETLQKPPVATVKQENTRICAECDKTTISPKHPLCASCMARRSNKKRPPKKKVPASHKKKETTQGKGKHKAVIVDSERYMEIVFSQKYSQVLKEVERLAEDQVRTTEEQIIYIIKTYLSNTQQPGAIK